MKMLNIEIEKNKKNINNHKEKIISDLLRTDKEVIKNTVQNDKNYSLWERIKKTLGIN
jgi:hypothetical protein